MIVAPGAGGVAASSARRIDNAFSASAGMTAKLAVARPASADEPPHKQTCTGSNGVHAVRRRVTAQKVTEDPK